MHFSVAHPYMQTSVNCNNHEIIQRILSVQLFIKVPFRYLEYLESLRLGHAK